MTSKRLAAGGEEAEEGGADDGAAAEADGDTALAATKIAAAHRGKPRGGR